MPSNAKAVLADPMPLDEKAWGVHVENITQKTPLLFSGFDVARLCRDSVFFFNA